MNQTLRRKIHNKYAPFWAVVMFLTCLCGILTIYIDLGAFWKGYVLDICGPAWNYILLRGLFTRYKENLWTKFFTPLKTFLIIVTLCFFIEFLQYLKIYDSVFDPLDLAAYLLLIMP